MICYNCNQPRAFGTILSKLLEQDILGKFWESQEKTMHDKSTKEQCAEDS
jgi:hypothetical protein